MNNRKVLILANHYITVYAFRRELVLELLNNGYEVYISFPITKEAKYFEELGCKLINSPIDRHGLNPINDLKLLFHYKKIIKDINPCIVLTYTIKPNVYGGIASGYLNIPYVANITGGIATSVDDKGLVQKIALFLYKIAFKNAACIFFQNEETRMKFINEKIVKNRHRMIPGSGVNLKQHRFEEYPDDDGVVRFLFIGRITKDKGIEELIEAAKIVKDKYSEVQFDAIGFYENDYKEKLKTIEEMNIIRFHGMKNDVHPYIKLCDAVVLPSYHEGMANALLEAASTGRPVIASDIHGCKETFDDGISGFGIEKKNVTDLVNKLIKFIKLPYEKKKEMGISGRKKMEAEFDRQIVVKAYLEEIEGQCRKN